MAVTTRTKAVTIKSTGNVKLDGEPIVSTAPADNTSTGAVKYQPPGKTTVDHLDADVVVVEPTPGPVTTTVSWLGEEDEAAKAALKVTSPSAALKDVASKSVKSTDPDVETPAVTPDDPKVETK